MYIICDWEVLFFIIFCIIYLLELRVIILRILHTADWHIGKIVNGVHMTLNRKYILSEMIKIIDETKPDVIVIAGDIYDRAVPPVDAVELVDRTFSRILLKMSIPIIAIAGNHDSAERISFASSILEDNGLYINGKFEDRVKKVVIKDKFGPVNFYLIPFSHPSIPSSGLPSLFGSIQRLVISKIYCLGPSTIPFSSSRSSGSSFTPNHPSYSNFVFFLDHPMTLL